MPEDGLEGGRNIFARIKDRFSSKFGSIHSTHRQELDQITRKSREASTQIDSLNELHQLQAQGLSEVTTVTAKAHFEIIRRLSREAAEVSLEKMAEDAQAEYDKAQSSGKDKQRWTAEVDMRIAAATQKLFDENREQFPSAADYIRDLLPDEKAKAIAVIEREVTESKNRFDKTKKRDDVLAFRLNSRILASARAIAAEATK